MKITPHVLHLKLAMGQVKYQCNAGRTCRPLLMRMQFTCTEWVESLNTRDDGGDNHIRTSCQNMNLYHCIAFFTFVAIC